MESGMKASLDAREITASGNLTAQVLPHDVVLKAKLPCIPRLLCLVLRLDLSYLAETLTRTYFR